MCLDEEIHAINDQLGKKRQVYQRSGTLVPRLLAIGQERKRGQHSPQTESCSAAQFSALTAVKRENFLSIQRSLRPSPSTETHANHSPQRIAHVSTLRGARSYGRARGTNRARVGSRRAQVGVRTGSLDGDFKGMG